MASKTGFEELLKSLVDYLRSQSQASVSARAPVQAGRIGTPEERAIAKQIVDLLRRNGYSFYVVPPAERRAELEPEAPEGNKFYSRHGRELYIFVKERGDMIDLFLFPDELNLFGAEAAWRIHSKAVIVSDAEEKSLDRAEAILQENGFVRWDHPEEVLLRYFSLGDFSVFEEDPGAQVVGVPGF